MEINNNKKNEIPPNNLTSQDVVNTGKEIARTTLVWTVSGVFTQLIRDTLNKILRK